VQTPCRLRLTFKIALDGELSDLQLEKSSGDEGVDWAALNAVREAAPFPHLPHFVDSGVNIEFTFVDNPIESNRATNADVR
jgi:TonB family protein